MHYVTMLTGKFLCQMGETHEPERCVITPANTELLSLTAPKWNPEDWHHEKYP